MSNLYGFTESFAQEVIDNWDYDFWVVKQIPNMECKCVDKLPYMFRLR